MSSLLISELSVELLFSLKRKTRVRNQTVHSEKRGIKCLPDLAKASQVLSSVLINNSWYH